MSVITAQVNIILIGYVNKNGILWPTQEATVGLNILWHGVSVLTNRPTLL